MAGETSIVAGMAGRYATALFELARDNNQLDQVEKDLNGFEAMLNESADLSRLVDSPVFSAEMQEKAITTLSGKAEFGATTKNFLGVITRNRRLDAIRDITRDFKKLLANHRGEVTAVATSATSLTDEQQASLRAALKDIAGQDIELITKVDPSILGGLIVNIGSRQIDDSLRTKLNNMKTRMKEVG